MNTADQSQVVRFSVTRSGDTLFVDIGGKDKQEMIALSDTTFSMMGIRLDFVTEKGVTNHMIIHVVEGDIKATKSR